MKKDVMEQLGIRKASENLGIRKAKVQPQSKTKKFLRAAGNVVRAGGSAFMSYAKDYAKNQGKRHKKEKSIFGFD